MRRIERASPEYPPSLTALPRPPDALWLEGNMPPGRRVAIVGTRRASQAALAFTEALARELSGAGITIVSGGARGIDAAAHRGALEGAGKTIVVQAGGLDRLYPKQHARLFDRVLAEGGLIASEAPPGTAALAPLFLSRNRLIAALAEVVIVTQAPIKSGAMSTAKWARKLERALFAVPHAPWEERGTGCVELLAGGARVCRSAREIADTVGLTIARSDHAAAPPADPDERAVLEALGPAPRHVDEVIGATTLSAPRVLLALTRLSLAGRARESAPSMWCGG